jgi:myosin heavy subunit
MKGKPFANKLRIVLILLLSFSLASCASSFKAKALSTPAANLVSQPEQDPNSNPTAAKESVPRPQLIKSAEISLRVKSIEKSSKAVSEIVKQQQGDILELNDFRSGNSDMEQSMFLKLRVPQERLDLVIEAIAQLGIVKGRSIKAEDVSNQLVDLQARLKNLRQTEVQLQGILAQTGSVGDVLKVTQELSRVREGIEQIDAQLKNLKNQVTYSTLQVNLASEITTISPQSDLGTQIQNTWHSSTNSLIDVSIGLLKVSIWLLVYCPYWLIPLSIFLFLRRRHRLLLVPKKAPESNESSEG